MSRHAVAVLLALQFLAAGEGFPLPTLGPWPVVVYRDEERHLAVELPVVLGGTTVSLSWRGGSPMAVVLPTEGPRRRSALLPWRPAEGGGELTAHTAWGSSTLPVRVVEAHEPWPIAGLREGRPVDDAGRAVVLLVDRMDGGGERRWAWLRAATQPGTGPLLVAAPPSWLPVLGEFGGATVALQHPVFPLHDVLPALAALRETPAAVLLLPGDGSLLTGGADAEEPRVLEAVARRWAGQERQPRLVLVLPALPLQASLREAALLRRQRFRRVAVDWSWALVDEERVAPAVSARALAPAVFATVPQGEHAVRLRAALAAALAR
jgi:hypothetical protein